jgi:Ser/Thr protein kinase RdoA (MazF antagonist)
VDDLAPALAAAAAALDHLDLRVVGEPLAGSRRATVVRAVTGDRTVIIKAFDRERAGEGWARETAALTVLGERGLPAPRLLASVADPPLLVMADLGRADPLSTYLLGDDPATAIAGLTRWASALGTLHAGTYDAAEPFATALGSMAIDSTADTLVTTTEWLAEGMAALDVQLTPAERAELGQAAELVGGPVALTPADACPDNNLDTADGLILLDFEGATIRPVAWDAAYLIVPWPSCWCSWRLPDGVATAAYEVWRSRAVPALSSVELGTHVARASLVWTFISAGWFLAGAVRDDPAPTRPGPTRRALIQHRLGLVTGAEPAGVVPLAEVAATQHAPLVALADRLRAATVRAWGLLELPLAPAFQ